jgi:hypothetical protein
MGLGANIVESVVREHSYKSIRGDVLLIGRQTVYLSREQYIEMMRRHGITPSDSQLARVAIDDRTIDRRPNPYVTETITDRSIFHVLGVDNVRALDHSDYEGAEIIHDLNKPLPEKLHSIADFIVDGSTIDNVFNPALALVNLNKLLRPGGRVLLVNMLSNHFEPYTIPNANWYLDYFAMNGFSDCKVYILVFCEPAPNIFCFNLECLLDPNFVAHNFASPHEMACVVFAEKSADSTTDRYPSQGHYRSSGEAQLYREAVASIRSNPRPHLLNSTCEISYFNICAGHLFVGSDYTERDPSSEQRRLQAAQREQEEARLRAAQPRQEAMGQKAKRISRGVIRRASRLFAG